MQFSEARSSYLAHAILEAFQAEGIARLQSGRERWVLNEIKRVIENEHALDARIDAAVRRKIDSLSRQVPPGSPEWDVLYRKYYEEEARRLRGPGA